MSICLIIKQADDSYCTSLDEDVSSKVSMFDCYWIGSLHNENEREAQHNSKTNLGMQIKSRVSFLKLLFSIKTLLKIISHKQQIASHPIYNSTPIVLQERRRNKI